MDQEPEAHLHSARLRGRTRELAEDLGKVNVSFDDWQVVYRHVLQLERALEGQTQLLDAQPRQETGERTMSKHSEGSTKGELGDRGVLATTRAGREEVTAPPHRPLENLSTSELVKELTSQVGLLAKKQIDLASSELRADLTAELAMVGGLGIAAIASILGLAVLLVAGVFALALVMPGWQAGLIVGGGLLLIAGIAAAVGWSKRVRSPLRRTRQTLKEDVQWGKEKLA